MNLTEAFARFDAALVNRQWAVSALSGRGELVLSCWAHMIKPGVTGVLTYQDNLARWSNNAPGQNLLRSHLVDALASKRAIRIAIATASDPAAVDAGVDASTITKTFHVREDWIGRLDYFDGESYCLSIRKA